MMEWEPKKVPEVVALVAMGSSRQNFIAQVMKCGSTKGIADEVWVINKLGCIYKHDILWRMDDLRKPRRINQRVLIDKENVIIHDRQTEWMKTHDKPIITTTAYPEFPTSVTYPLEDVINTIGYSYFLTTPAYAVAFAVHIGVKHLKIYGCDFVYPDDKYHSEMGKGNMEFILAIAMMKGVKIEIAQSSTLLGTHLPPGDCLYAYEDIIEVVESKTPGKRYEINVRKDLTEKRDKRKADVEKAHLQDLMFTYREDVKRDLIKGKWITKDDIEQYELLDAQTETPALLPPLPEASQDEKPKGEQDDKSRKVHKRRNKRSKQQNDGAADNP